MVWYVKGRVTLAKLRFICNNGGFSSFMLKGRLIDLSWNLHDKQHQIKVTTRKRDNKGRGELYEEFWPDDFRYYLESLPDHAAVRVEADRDVPRVVVLNHPTVALREEVKSGKRLKG